MKDCFVAIRQAQGFSQWRDK